VTFEYSRHVRLFYFCKGEITFATRMHKRICLLFTEIMPRLECYSRIISTIISDGYFNRVDLPCSERPVEIDD